ncbi:hypothetical protein [Photorhabdus temperata]|uniref:Uncharacterized protein n=1 Tax=Photorhabdus temperata subsp. temperata Meg1 TaxID=1393735 RepID=A0A081RY25_PHOTE|nr:hypothetical protein [Photorhabdus temperata]KER03578.1 hypothetical protein MEG1DRAFT_01682 [Photorhabdus temperata subsp. temperata Meg1]
MQTLSLLTEISVQSVPLEAVIGRKVKSGRLPRLAILIRHLDKD